jgi:hypothetical protein
MRVKIPINVKTPYEKSRFIYEDAIASCRIGFILDRDGNSRKFRLGAYAKRNLRTPDYVSWKINAPLCADFDTMLDKD